MDPAVSGHEFEPRTRSTPQIRIRVAQGEALRIKRGEPLLPGDVLELAGADRGKVDMQVPAVSVCAAVRAGTP